MYLIAVVVNLLLPCGPDFATGLIERSLVQIAAGTSDSITPSGTGFAVSGDGHILTSRRAVMDLATGLPRPLILVKLPGGLVVQGHFVGADANDDLAMVKVDGVDDLRPAKWGDVGSCVVGQRLVAAGYVMPGDGRFASAPTFAYGAISSLGGLGGAGYVEHQAEVSSTMIGGPLLTMCGEVVGVSTKAGGTAVASSVAQARAAEWSAIR